VERRAFLSSIAGALLAARPAEAQLGKALPRIGFLGNVLLSSVTAAIV
jgi:hypothetical protein